MTTSISMRGHIRRRTGQACTGKTLSQAQYLGISACSSFLVLISPDCFISAQLAPHALLLCSCRTSHLTDRLTTPRTPNRTVRALKRTCGSYTSVRIITVSGRGLVSETIPSARAYRRDLYQLHAHPSRSQSPSVASTIELVSEIGNRAREVDAHLISRERVYPRHSLLNFCFRAFRLG